MVDGEKGKHFLHIESIYSLASFYSVYYLMPRIIQMCGSGNFFEDSGFCIYNPNPSYFGKSRSSGSVLQHSKVEGRKPSFWYVFPSYFLLAIRGLMLLTVFIDAAR